MSTTIATGVYRRASGRLMIAWYQRGQLCREHLPTGASVTDAKNLRKQKLGEAVAAGLAALPGRCRFEDLVALLKTEHELKRRTRSLEHNLARLTAAFAGWKAKDITTAALETYVSERRAAGAADNTIKNQLATLRHAFNLARKRDLVTRVPAFPMPTDQATVQCYFSAAEVDRLLALLPATLRPAVEFAVATGLRKGNVARLTWPEVHLDRAEIVLAGVVMKSGEPLTIPFAPTSRVAAILREQLRRRPTAATVFELPDTLLRKAWAKAVGRKGLNKWGRKFDSRVGGFVPVRARFHDLRHSFAQAMIDSGVDEGIVMELGGWKTRSMLDRYAIKTDAAKRKALAQRDAHLKAERQAARRQARVIDLMAARRTA